MAEDPLLKARQLWGAPSAPAPQAANKARNPFSAPTALSHPPEPEKAPLLKRPSQSAAFQQLQAAFLQSASAVNQEPSPVPYVSSSALRPISRSGSQTEGRQSAPTAQPVSPPKHNVESSSSPQPPPSSEDVAFSASFHYEPQVTNNGMSLVPPAPHASILDQIEHTEHNDQHTHSHVYPSGEEEPRTSEDVEHAEEEEAIAPLRNMHLTSKSGSKVSVDSKDGDESRGSEGSETAFPVDEVLMRFRKPVEDEQVLTSRRGTIVGTAGAVQARRKAFASKAEKLTATKSLADQLEESEAQAGEAAGGKIVIYTTSVSTVKETYSACQEMRKIFQRARVPFEERDIFLDTGFSKELAARLPGASVPFAFFNGKPLGDFATVLKLNENDVFPSLFEFMTKIKNNDSGDCGQCGGRGFYTCTWCGGSKKSMSNRYGRAIVSLKCTCCNENGLMRCSACAFTDC